MTLPTSVELFEALEVTWPPASRRQFGPWTIREGRGGGRRVSAATGKTTDPVDDAENAMSTLGQPHLFMIRDGDGALDQALDARGYLATAPTTAFCCPIRALTDQNVGRLAGFQIWPPLAIMDEIWNFGGVGTGRRAVMNRVSTSKTAIMGRANNRAAGAAFVALHQQIAMIHAIEVTPSQRRLGVGINIVRTAAHWAQKLGAGFFSLYVTDANLAAIALYKKLGMTAVGHYHYRIKQE